MKMINKMGLAVSLVLASSLASANVYDLGDLTSSASSQDVVPGVAGLFTDTFNFTFTSGSFLNAYATSPFGMLNDNVVFDNIAIFSEGLTGTTGTLAGIFSVAEFTSGSTGSSVFLDAGNYALSISGEAFDANVGYTLVTSPVPEPSSIALMLGGLGLVGFMAARRSKKA